MTPGRLVAELAVGRCVRVTLGGALGTTCLLDVHVIAVTSFSLRAVSHVTITVLTACVTRNTTTVNVKVAPQSTVGLCVTGQFLQLP